MSPAPHHPPVIETARLRLAPLTGEDATLIFPLMANAEVMAFWDVGEIDDPDVIAAIVLGQIEEMAKGRAVHWTLRLLCDGAFIGICDISEIDQRHHRTDVGFMLDREAWEKAMPWRPCRRRWPMPGRAASNGCLPAPIWATAAPRPCSNGWGFRGRLAARPRAARGRAT